MLLLLSYYSMLVSWSTKGKTTVSWSNFVSSFLFLPSGSTGLEEKKALWEAAGTDWWDVVDHWVPEGGARERQHKHWSAEEHGLRC